MVEAACSMATVFVRHGQEPFPGPDNQSKMKRSVENVEHVGLFIPTAGHHFREAQRTASWGE
ncbi:hypothetical protein FVEN_g13001 [Fusarium venenatum]|uniref:Uncharacterized protein n=1 Tax=Fusarium venenatum TaxID=56646 RepID=A0A2L2SZQ0_9HYPO|nr:uncharacterized protein FVRRES_04929 [Fusarium venenatum]KAG8351991.1 hypothetical protein FVEN_g13001 [Fusarium venenatum]KAH6992059.1 hypothetical protein EDB82DRAFT_127005 [Fusarium venenatum]CEI60493.1 unnamed protein product [Fusarium venenatum]